MNKVAIYCRLSAEDRNKQQETDESLSIQNQKMMLINYSIQNGWEIYNIYSDEDFTGADRNRPEFNRLLADAANKKFNIVLCKSQSRFTRELEMVEKYIHGLFVEWGIRFIGLVDQADTENRGNKKARQINGLVNEWYLEDLSDNIRKTLTERRKEGLHIGSFALYGYYKDPDVKGHLLIDPEAAQVVREIFYLFDQGYGKTSIARELNRKGIPSPSIYKQQKGLNYRNGRENSRSAVWQYFMIQDILKNEMYIGNMIQGRSANISYKSTKKKPVPKENWLRKEHTHEPIIDMDLWNRVQNRIQFRTKPAYDGKLGLFAYKARCMYCGYSMRSAKTRGRRYLRCGTKMVSANTCEGGFISEEELKKTVYHEWIRMINQYLNMSQAENSIMLENHYEELIDQKKKELRKINNKKAKLEMAVKRLYLDHVSDIITMEEYISFKEDFQREAKELKDQAAQLQEKCTELQKQKENRYSRQELLQKYIHYKELNRDVINRFIDYIEIGKRAGRKEMVPVIIHWNF